MLQRLPYAMRRAALAAPRCMAAQRQIAARRRDSAARDAVDTPRR